MMRFNTMHLKVQSGLVQMVFDVITFEESLCLRAKFPLQAQYRGLDNHTKVVAHDDFNL